mgnify:CR=1 FL=1|jgi:hypothetical protein
MAKVKDLIERLQAKDPEEEIAVAIWHIDDVKDTAEENDITLTDEQATTVIRNVDHQHDACIGINWEVIQCHIDMLDN